MPEEPYSNPPRYIGDGVYVKDNQDGSLTLFTDRETGRHWLVLGNNEWEGLKKFVENVCGWK